MPAGSTAIGTSEPTSAAIVSITVPSPPETASRSTPSAIAVFASSRAPSSLLVAMNWQVYLCLASASEMIFLRSSGAVCPETGLKMTTTHFCLSSALWMSAVWLSNPQRWLS